MSSERKRKANRSNGQKSRGPKNTNGTRYNARKHGLLAAGLTELDKVERNLLRTLMAELKPVGQIENILVQSAALEIIRLSRARRLEAEYITSLLNPPGDLGISFDEVFNPGKPAAISAESAQRLVNIFQRYESVIFNRFLRTLHELERRQRMRLGDSVAAPTILDVSVEVASSALTEIASPPVPSSAIPLGPSELCIVSTDATGDDERNPCTFEGAEKSGEQKSLSDQDRSSESAGVTRQVIPPGAEEPTETAPCSLNSRSSVAAVPEGTLEESEPTISTGTTGELSKRENQAVDNTRRTYRDS